MQITKQAKWAGLIASGLASAGLLLSSVMKLLMTPDAIAMMTGLGYPESVIRPIGVVELLCVVLYLVPRTSVLGAILATAYLGGATTSHVRVGEPFLAPVILGILFWAGLYLRDIRIRALMPLRR